MTDDINISVLFDQGYVMKTHGHAAFRGNNLTPAMQAFNTAMSPERVGAEWTFNKVSQNTAFVDCHKIHKVYLSQVGKVYWLVAILANAHTCLYGSTASTYWMLTPPTLGSYFQNPAYDVLDL